MPECDLELQRLQLVVEGMRHYGQAAWRHPDEMQSFYEQMKPFLQLNGKTLAAITNAGISASSSDEPIQTEMV